MGLVDEELQISFTNQGVPAGYQSGRRVIHIELLRAGGRPSLATIPQKPGNGGFPLAA